MGVSVIDANRNAKWYARVDSLRSNCTCATHQETAKILSDAFDLLSSPPSAVLSDIGTLPDRAVFDRLLSVDAFASAALALQNGTIGYMMSRGPSGVALASVILRGEKGDVTSEGADPALALVGALLAALHRNRDNFGRIE